MEISMTTTCSNSSRSRRRVRVAFAALSVFLLAGCNGDRGGGGAAGAGDLSGTYQATGSDGGTMTLEFKSGGKVRMTMQEPGGQPDPADGDYMIDGNNVTIQVPGGMMPLVLVRNGDRLDANFMGEILHFTKK
jgi:hypothetical protein